MSEPTDADMRAFGASDEACYRWPEDTPEHKALRRAFIDGAAASMPSWFNKIAEYMGELYGAAKHDLTASNPADVGLNGVSVIGWREAYLEGCKDMAEGVVTRIPEDIREAVKAIVRASFVATLAKESATPETER